MKPITDLRQLTMLRRLTALASILLAILAASGVIETKVFSEPSTLKYVITVGAPVILLACALVEWPLHLATCLVVVAAPFVSATATLGALRISLLVPLLVLGYAFAAVAAPLHASRPALLWPAVLFFPLMLIPLVAGADNHELIVSVLLLIAIAVLVARTTSEGRGLSTVFFALAVQSGLQAVIAIYEAKTGHTLNLYSAVGGTQYAANNLYVYGGVTRPTGTFGDPIGFANGLAITVPILVALAIAVTDQKVRVVIVIVVALVGVALGYALDRTSWIGVAVGLAVLVVALPAPVRRHAMPWLLSGVALAIAATVSIEGGAITQKFASIFHPTQRVGVNAQAQGEAAGETARLRYWYIAFHLGFLRHPLAGIGLDRMRQLIISHSATSGPGFRQGTANFDNAASTYLQILGDAGLLGLAMFISLFYGLWRDIRAGLRRNPVLAAGLFGAVVAMLICWVTDVVVITQEPVAACVGVLLGAVAGAGRKGLPARDPDQSDAPAALVPATAL